MWKQGVVCSRVELGAAGLTAWHSHIFHQASGKNCTLLFIYSGELSRTVRYAVRIFCVDSARMSWPRRKSTQFTYISMILSYFLVDYGLLRTQKHNQNFYIFWFIYLAPAVHHVPLS